MSLAPPRARVHTSTLSQFICFSFIFPLFQSLVLSETSSSLHVRRGLFGGKNYSKNILRAFCFFSPRKFSLFKIFLCGEGSKLTRFGYKIGSVHFLLWSEMLHSCFVCFFLYVFGLNPENKFRFVMLSWNVLEIWYNNSIFMFRYRLKLVILNIFTCFFM